MALVVLTGGARSGKSRAAQDLACELDRRGRRVVVAVFGTGAGDDEMAERIARHRADRPASFSVVEATDPWSWLEGLGPADALVVDCLGTWLGSAMAEAWAAGEQGAFSDATEASSAYRGAVEAAGERIVELVCGRVGDTIVVTNEVGSGVVPDHATGRLFRDTLGRMNTQLTAAADAAYLAVAGRLVDLTALPQSVRWPED